MNWLYTFLYSSIGKKVIMGGSGLLLVLFCVFHLAGNVLMYVGPETYNQYAHALHSQEWLIRIAEFGLLGLFTAHIFLALTTDRENTEARPVRYAVTKTNRKDRFFPAWLAPENLMFFSGVTVLVFLILHLCDFTFMIRMHQETAGREPFEKAIIILQNPLSATIYIVGVLLLGWHLVHAFASAFRTLGLNHPKYNGLILQTSRILSIVVGVGFASFPIYANLVHPRVEPVSASQKETGVPESHSPGPASTPGHPPGDGESTPAKATDASTTPDTPAVP